MQFRNLRAEDLEGSVEIAGLDPWMRSIGATDASVLIVAPPGTGKAAAVGRLAHRLGRNVLLCNLLELFDCDDPRRQLASLLRICEAQRRSVVYLDKLDKALARWAESGDGESLETMLEGWLGGARQRLLDDECTVVFTGGDRQAVPERLVRQFDKSLIA